MFVGRTFARGKGTVINSLTVYIPAGIILTIIVVYVSCFDGPIRLRNKYIGVDYWTVVGNIFFIE